MLELGTCCRRATPHMSACFPRIPPPALGLADCLWVCVISPSYHSKGAGFIGILRRRKTTRSSIILFSLHWFAGYFWGALVAWSRHATHRSQARCPAFISHLRVQVFGCSDSRTEHSARGSLQQGTVELGQHGGNMGATRVQHGATRQHIPLCFTFAWHSVHFR